MAEEQQPQEIQETRVQEIDRKFSNNTAPLKADERPKIKAKFLEVMAQTNIFTVACDAAGVTRRTVYKWKESGFLSDEEMKEAYRRYQDGLRAELEKRARYGIREPWIQNGRWVIDPTTGEKLFHEKVDTRLLERIAAHHLEEWAEDKTTKQEITVHHDAIPDQFRLVLDLRMLTVEEVAYLRRIAERLDREVSVKQQERIVESSLSLQ